MLRSLLLLVLLLAACSTPGSERTFRAGDVTVIDASGLVTGAGEGAPLPESTQRPLVTRAGSLTRIAVHWTGPSCVRDWTVRVGGNRLLVAIEPGEAADACDGTTAEHGVTLDLNRVVDAAAVEVEQRSE